MNWIKKYKLKYLAVFFIAFAFFAFLQSAPVMPDPDGFYHAKTALLISDRGILQDFPFLQFTTLKYNYIDHHLLYHLILVPFVKFFNPLVGVKLAQSILAAIFITVFYWFLKKEKVKLPLLWTIILMANSPFIFRASLVKANAFSLIILFIGLYAIFYRKYWLLLIISYLYVLSYGGWPLILTCALIFIISDWLFQKIELKTAWKKLKINLLRINRKGSNIKLLFSCSVGLFLGLVINPYFPKNLKFYWEQIIQIGIINYQDKIGVGGEWYPYEPLELLASSGLAAIFFLIAAVIFFISLKKQNEKSLSLLIITLFFLVITLKSRRYIEYLIPFAVAFSAIATTRGLNSRNAKEFCFLLRNFYYKKTKCAIAVIIFFISAGTFLIIRDVYKTKQELSIGSDLNLYKNASEFIKKNSSSGDIVFHADWDDFPALFYHNSKNYYLVGLDPTFMYNYDADLYEEWVKITTGEDGENLYNKITKNFSAKFIFLDNEHSALNNHLFINPNFQLAYSDDEAKVYKIR
ncbi:hypothetical protein KAI52_02110 [Candidatus Parcubacteria bacterium]|nr:hypothetical protein [Candidatus Parcubacteria bacterium]